ncbi:MAG: hypothetical protein E7254_05425 [Lachnospiraceae bacterium]|nr:hypothetical protein [Lachnospiraceae bacterium]
MKQTYIDTLVSMPSLELVKALLPYMKLNNKYLIILAIKYYELMRVTKIKNIINQNNIDGNFFDIIKDYIDPESLENMEMIKSIFDLMASGEMPFDIDNFKELF